MHITAFSTLFRGLTRAFAGSILLCLALVASLGVFADTACTAAQQEEAKLLGLTFATDCAPAALPTYNDARAAIHSGGAAWLAPVLDLLLGCITPTVRDELAAHNLMALLDEQQIDEWAARLVPTLRGGERAELLALAAAIEVEASSKLASASPDVALLGGATRGEILRAQLAIAIERAAMRVKLHLKTKATK